jgi:DNA-binding beta-propeller fold protein YncE
MRGLESTAVRLIDEPIVRCANLASCFGQNGLERGQMVCQRGSRRIGTLESSAGLSGLELAKCGSTATDQHEQWSRACRSVPTLQVGRRLGSRDLGGLEEPDAIDRSLFRRQMQSPFQAAIALTACVGHFLLAVFRRRSGHRLAHGELTEFRSAKVMNSGRVVALPPLTGFAEGRRTPTPTEPPAKIEPSSRSVGIMAPRRFVPIRVPSACHWGVAVLLAVGGLGLLPAQSQASTRNTSAPVKISIPSNPEAMVVSPNGAFAYLAYINSPSMAVVNLTTHKVREVHLAAAHGQLTDIARSPNGQQIYVTEQFSQCPCHALVVVNAATDQASTPVGVGESADVVAVSPNGRYLYLSESDTLEVVEVATMRVVAVIPLGSSYLGSAYIAVSPNGETVYVASNSGDNGAQPVPSQLEVVSITAKKVIKIIDQGNTAPSGLAANPNGSEVYESFNSNAPSVGDGLHVLDTASNTISHQIPISSLGIAFSADGDYAYVANSSPSGVSVIETSKNKVVSKTPIATGSTFSWPDCVALRANGEDLYATNFYLLGPSSGSLYVIPLGASASR